MHIGKRIQQAMEAKKISTKAMADACGVTPGAVSNWFSSGRIAKDNLAIVARQLGVSVEELITGEADARPVAPIPGASFYAQKLATWLDKIQDEQAHHLAYAAAMEVILRAVNGLPPLPTHTPDVHGSAETLRAPPPAQQSTGPSRKKSRAGPPAR